MHSSLKNPHPAACHDSDVGRRNRSTLGHRPIVDSRIVQIAHAVHGHLRIAGTPRSAQHPHRFRPASSFRRFSPIAAANALIASPRSPLRWHRFMRCPSAPGSPAPRSVAVTLLPNSYGGWPSIGTSNPRQTANAFYHGIARGRPRPRVVLVRSCSAMIFADQRSLPQGRLFMTACHSASSRVPPRGSQPAWCQTPATSPSRFAPSVLIDAACRVHDEVSMQP